MMYGNGMAALAGYGANAFGCGRFGMPMMFFGLVLIVLGVIAVVQYVKKSNHKEDTTTEMELLNTRFVKGELTEEEYTAMKRVLKSK